MIEVPFLALLMIQFQSFNVNFFPSPKHVPTPYYPFGGNLGEQVKCRSLKKLKSLIEVPYVAHLKSAGSKLQYERYLFSVVCS